jgi:hypothetical protein
VKTRELKVILVDQAGGGTGVDAKTIRYTGQVASVNFKK